MANYEGYKELGNAIVLQAIEDYRYSILMEKTLNDDFESGKINDDYYITHIRPVKSEQRSLCKFFKSAWCEYLSNLCNTDLAKKLKEQTLEFKKRADAALSDPQTYIDQNYWNSHYQECAERFKNVFCCPTCGGTVGMTYGFVGWAGNRKKRYNLLGWRVKCASCGFTIKEVREEEKKGVKK